MGTSATHITGPEDTRFGFLRRNIVLQLVLYYAAVFFIGYWTWRILPPWLKEQVSAATGHLVGTTGRESTFTTPDPKADALDPTAVAIMGIMASGSALVFSLPISWVFMFTRRKKGYDQAIVHTLLLLPLVVAMVATLVRSSVALAFSLAGIVAAVRFRVSLDNSRDAVFVFAVMALGLASGVQLETAAVLSILFVTLSLVLWYTDFARTPPALEGERAQKHMEKALAIANRTSQFVARLDREILESMAPAQLAALQQRLDKRKEKLGVELPPKEEEGPRYDGRLTFIVTDAEQAMPAVEAALNARAKRWKAVRTEQGHGEARLVYSVKSKKDSSLDELAQAVTHDASPFVANVEAERWV